MARIARKAQKSLETYRQKRDFAVTAEPSGDDAAAGGDGGHLRFVIQKHDARRLHYDLRLEVGGVFRSWAVTKGPSLDPADKRLAVETEDHPLAYGDFEGTIPQGEYGGGTVMIWDRGFWAPETDEAPETSLERGELKFVLAGAKVQGGFVLVRMKRKSGETRDNWLLIKHRDDWSREDGGGDLLDKDRSVASGRTMAAIAKGTGPEPKPFVDAGRLPKADGSDRWSGVPDAKSVGLPRLTSPDRELWPDASPAITKRDLAEYLIEAAPFMLPHVAGRLTSLVRAPDGVGGQTFFQRHPMAGQAELTETVRLDDEHDPYLMIADAGELVGLAQISAVEIHCGNGAPFDPRVPGRLVFDLDPAPDLGFDEVVAAARDLAKRLDDLGLVGFCKTSGGKGLHVVAPLTPDPAVDWQEAKLFAETVCAAMAEEAPERFTTKMAKRQRKGRIFLDYLRNDTLSTAVAPLSPRARKDAPVSMPLNWTQVRKGLDPSRFTMRTALKLLRQSAAWADYEGAARPLREAARRLVGGV